MFSPVEKHRHSLTVSFDGSMLQIKLNSIQSIKSWNIVDTLTLTGIFLNVDIIFHLEKGTNKWNYNSLLFKNSMHK